jgi:hypothetical protein
MNKNQKATHNVSFEILTVFAVTADLDLTHTMESTSVINI